VARIVDIADIAERGPALGRVGAFSFGGVVVIFELRPVREIDSTGNAGRLLPAAFVEGVEVAEDRASNRAGMLQPIRRIDHDETIAFAAGIIFVNDWPPPLYHLLLDVDSTGRGRMDRTAMRGQLVLAFYRFGQAQQPHEHGGYPLAVRDAVALDQ